MTCFLFDHSRFTTSKNWDLSIRSSIVFSLSLCNFWGEIRVSYRPVDIQWIKNFSNFQKSKLRHHARHSHTHMGHISLFLQCIQTIGAISLKICTLFGWCAAILKNTMSTHFKCMFHTIQILLMLHEIVNVKLTVKIPSSLLHHRFMKITFLIHNTWKTYFKLFSIQNPFLFVHLLVLLFACCCWGFCFVFCLFLFVFSFYELRMIIALLRVPKIRDTHTRSVKSTRPCNFTSLFHV